MINRFTNPRTCPPRYDRDIAHGEFQLTLEWLSPTNDAWLDIISQTGTAQAVSLSESLFLSLLRVCHQIWETAVSDSASACSTHSSFQTLHHGIIISEKRIFEAMIFESAVYRIIVISYDFIITLVSNNKTFEMFYMQQLFSCLIYSFIIRY